MSRVSSGEVKQTPSTGDVQIYPGVPNNQDNLVDPNVLPGDENRIYSNKFPWINNVRYISSRLQKLQNLAKNAKSSLAKQTGEVLKKVVNKALEPYGLMQDAMSSGVGNYADGKSQNLLGISPMARIIPTIAGLGAGINQLAWWKRQDIDTPDTYAPNPYAGRALSTLAGLKDNPYNQLRQMLDVERRGIYETNRAGGLTGSLKYTANVASNIGLQKNYADVLRTSNENRNKNLAQYALAALQAGAQDAQNRQNANQFGYTAYRDAHGKKVKGIETGITNMLQQLQGGFQNEFKYRMANKTLEMYLQELDNEKRKIAALYPDKGTTGTTTTSPAATTKPTAASVGTTIPIVATPPYSSAPSSVVFKQDFLPYVYDTAGVEPYGVTNRSFNPIYPTLPAVQSVPTVENRGIIDYTPLAGGYVYTPFYSRRYYRP